MKNLKFILYILIFGLGLQANISYAQSVTTANKYVKYNVIQVALLLDVSGSMSGLLDQAKIEIWNVVNEAANARKQGVPSKLEIGLYEYGNGYSSTNGFIRRIMDFSSDLDTISKNLFSLKISGSAEYCGEVLMKSLDELQWRDADSVFRVVFIAGNEPFNQGSINYKESAEKAKKKDILINTIHCGEESTGISQLWKDGAISGNGKFFCINHNAVIASVNTPYDKLIDSLNDLLNKTYLSYGKKGYTYRENQVLQDKNNKSASHEGYMKRVEAKSKKAAYSNTTWDAIDAYESDSMALERIFKEGVDSVYQVKTKEDLKKLIDSFSLKRIQVQKQIANLSVERQKYIIEEQKKAGKGAESTLGNALIEALHEQTKSKGFYFEAKK